MTDLDFNSNKVEQMCLRKLVQVDIVPQTDKPYSLQLLMWTLDGHQRAIPSRARKDLETLLSVASRMFQWDAKTIQSYLLGELPWPREELKTLEGLPPEHLGGQIADNLYAKLLDDGTL
jgi:hypothetical protein